MLSTILSSIIAFIGTNIDDILVLTLLLSGTRRRGRVFAGYLLGIFVLAALSALAADGLRFLSAGWLRLLGIVPIALGVRALFGRGGGVSEVRPSVFGAALITLGNGADNLGVYIPLFARLSAGRVVLSSLVFLAMGVLWVFLAGRIASLPALRRIIGSRALVPAVFILLGLYILLLSI